MHVCFSGLPSKSKEEEKRHRKLYEAVVESAKRKGQEHLVVCEMKLCLLVS